MQRKVFFFTITALLLGFFITTNAFSWGFFAHKKVNRMAVFTLPPDIIGFYKQNIEYISGHAVDPDRRRYADDEEACRHYIDADRYGDHPFDSIPKYWKEAVEKYSEDTLKAHGILPWHIEKMMFSLTKAFKEKDTKKILRLSADMGHYIADAHVPLHTTKNYNGQLSNQKGIHGFWESRIPELKADNYDYLVGRAHYIEKPIEAAWEMVKASYIAKDSVLGFEAELNDKFPKDKKYSYEDRGSKTVKVYSLEYTNEYDKMLNGMVERRMREAVIMVGCLWYTAWVNAGQPQLEGIINKEELDTIRTEDPTPKCREIKGHED